MSEPLIFINTYSLTKQEGYREAVREWSKWNEAEHPRLLHNEVYFSEDGTQVTNIQVHPDAESMELQMQLVADVHGKWREFIDWSTMRLVLCGTPSEALLKGLREVAGSGVPVSINAPIDGFSRLPAA